LVAHAVVRRLREDIDAATIFALGIVNGDVWPVNRLCAWNDNRFKPGLPAILRAVDSKLTWGIAGVVENGAEINRPVGAVRAGRIVAVSRLLRRIEGQLPTLPAIERSVNQSVSQRVPSVRKRHCYAEQTIWITRIGSQQYFVLRFIFPRLT